MKRLFVSFAASRWAAAVQRLRSVAGGECVHADQQQAVFGPSLRRVLEWLKDEILRPYHLEMQAVPATADFPPGMVVLTHRRHGLDYLASTT